MADLFDLVAKLTLDSSEYESGLSKAEGEASSFGSKLKSGLGTAAKVGAAGVAAIGAAAIGTTTAVTKAVSSTAQYGDNIDKMSQKMGLSAQAYQEWDAIMQHGGTSMETLKAGMKTLANAVENDNKAFERLGISQEQIAGMNQEELFSTTISALQNVEDETERTYLAGQLLGRGATELGALLNTSAEDTEAMRQRVHELGGVMSDDAVKASARFQDNMQDLTTAMAGVKRGMTAELLPGFNDVIAGFTSMIAGEEGAEEQLTSGVENIVTKFNEMLPRLSGIISGVGGSLISVAPQIVEGAMSLVLSLGEALIQNAPMLIDSALQIAQVLIQGLVSAAPMMATGALQIISQLASGLGQMAPMVITAATQLVSDLLVALTDPASLNGVIEGAIALVEGLADGIIQALPILIETIPLIVDNIVNFLTQSDPQLLTAAGQIITELGNGLIQALPMLLSILPQLITSVTTGIMTLAPQMLSIGMSLIMNIATGLLDALPQLYSALPPIINQIVTTLASLAPQLIITGIQMLGQLAIGLVQAIPQILSMLPEIVSSIGQGLIDLAPTLLNAGKELAKSAWEGIKGIFTGGDKADASESVDFSGIEEKSQSAASAVSTAFADMNNTVSFTQVGTDAQTAFTGIGTSAETAATSVTTSFANVGTDISTALSSASTGANFTAVTANAQQAAQQTIAAFSTVPEGLGDNWEATQSIYKDAPSFFQKTFEAAKESVLSVWGTLPDEFRAVWEQIKNVYKEAPTWFQTTFTTVKDNVTQIMSQIATDATTWGQDMMDNFNQGIQNRQGALNETLNNVAQDVNDTVGFSEPKKGPLSDFHTYAPDMMNLFMQGIRENTPALRKTVEKSFDFRESFKAPEATISSSRTADTSNAKMDAVLAILQQYLPELVNRDIVLDSGVTVGALLPQIDSGLGQSYSYKARGNA